MSRSRPDLARLAQELAALAPAERAKVIANATGQERFRPPPRDWKPPLLTGGTHSDGGLDDGSAGFQGCWRITKMQLWDSEAIDMMGPGFISFTGNGGYFRFICVEGDLDCHVSVKRGRPHVEWTWDGQDECDPASGRGWATLQKDSSLAGRFFIQGGDSSAFIATKSERDLNTGRGPPPYRSKRRW